MHRAFVTKPSALLSNLGRCAAILTMAACSSATAPPAAPSAAPPARPPTPTTVTQSNPGGDADDPHRAALERLLASPWGARSDKGDQVLAPLPDWENWRRVRYYGFDHLAGFRYGKEYHAVSVARVQELPPGTIARSETCLRAIEAWVRPQLKGFEVKLGPIDSKLTRWRDQALEIHTVDGWVSWGVGSSDFSAAWTAYPAYPNACLVFGIAVPWRDQRELAVRVRDRFVSEGLTLLQALTPDVPKTVTGPPKPTAALSP